MFESPAAPSLSRYLSTLTACGGGAISAEVALDLVLNEIVERACLATSATAGAIALAQEGAMVCRATTGNNAPDLGVRFDTTHGLSGACVRTGKWQRCNDTENDSRVNSEVSRHLGVRSIVVVPIQRAGELIGVIEVFSIRADAFGDSEVRCLQAFAEEVVENVESAAGTRGRETPSLLPDPAEPAVPAEATNFDHAIAAPSFDAAIAPPVATPEVSFEVGEAPPRKDVLTTVLLVCVVGLALIVGWMVGRGEWARSNPRPVAPARQAAADQSEVSPENSTMAHPVENPEPAQPVSAVSNSRATIPENPPDDGLIVSRDGKVVFRSPAPDSQAVEPAADSGNSAVESSRPRISPEIAEEYVTTRVEPQYPPKARVQHIEGPVVLDVSVGKDGAVQKLTAISGSPVLVPAALDAVRQWRFQPFFYEGQPQGFVTRITVDFRLP
jgi:TonB family protein